MLVAFISESIFAFSAVVIAFVEVRKKTFPGKLWAKVALASRLLRLIQTRISGRSLGLGRGVHCFSTGFVESVPDVVVGHFLLAKRQ